MLYLRFSFIATAILLAAAALGQTVSAQTEVNSDLNKISTVESLQKRTIARGNAEILGTIELETATERSLAPDKLPATRAIKIEPVQRDLFTPRPVTPAEADATIDRGIQVIIDNP